MNRGVCGDREGEPDVDRGVCGESLIMVKDAKDGARKKSKDSKGKDSKSTKKESRREERA